MALTRVFRDTVKKRAKQDPEFRVRLITEALNSILEGDMGTGKSLLRDYLNATDALADIAMKMNKNDKSIRRMVGPAGNPTMKNFINLINACTENEHIQLRADVVSK